MPNEITPMDMFATSLASDVDPERLRVIMELHEKWERNQATKLFAAAMHRCQSQMPSVIKDAANAQTKSRYATLENVQEIARPIYSAHGFSLCFAEEDCPQAGYKRTVCDVTHEAGAERRYHLDLPVDGVGAKGNAIGAMNPVQAAISTTSYGQRRLLCMVFNVTIAGEDNDAQLTRPQAITAEQAEEIEVLLDAMKAQPDEIFKILAWQKVKTWDQLPAAKFSDVARFIEGKIKERTPA
jgi:hypothetical protein